MREATRAGVRCVPRTPELCLRTVLYPDAALATSCSPRVRTISILSPQRVLSLLSASTLRRWCSLNVVHSDESAVNAVLKVVTGFLAIVKCSNSSDVRIDR
jgi:hypothetical protein